METFGQKVADSAIFSKKVAELATFIIYNSLIIDFWLSRERSFFGKK
jgi:hypothetical protein